MASAGSQRDFNLPFAIPVQHVQGHVCLVPAQTNVHAAVADLKRADEDFSDEVRQPGPVKSDLTCPMVEFESETGLQQREWGRGLGRAGNGVECRPRSGDTPEATE